MKLVTSEQMRNVDREAIDNRKIPSEKLMENAGQGIALAILDELITVPEGTAVAVFCGKGNNGGDGYVVARILHEAGVSVSICFLGPVEKFAQDARLNYDRAVKTGLAPKEITSIDQLPMDPVNDFVIDAVFGTGFSGAPRGLSIMNSPVPKP